MKKIFKILKKYSLSILVIIFLLVCQAMCDLALPDYTSKIVNVGIQQSGIENSVLEYMSEDTYNKVLLLSDDKELIKNSYKIDGDIYVLKDINEKEDLEKNLNKTLVLIQNLENEEIKENFSESLGVKIDDVFVFLSSLSEDIRASILSEGTKKIESLEDSMLSQMAVSFVKEEYEKIGIDTDEIQMKYVFEKGAQMLLIALLSMAITVLTVFLSAKVGAGFGRDLRSKTVSKTMTLSNKEFEKLGSSSLITRCTNDITQVQTFIVVMFRMVFYAPIIGFGALGKVSGNSMSWVIGVAVLAILSLVIILFTFALPKFKVIQTLIDKLNLVSREILSGLPVIRAFSNEKHEEERFDKANKDLTKVNIFVGRIMTIMMPTMTFIMNGVSILIVWVGASKIDAGTMQVGTLMAFISYTMQIIMSFLMLSMMSFMMPRAFVSMKRIAEVLDIEVTVKDKKKTKTFLKEKRGIVEFKDVYFRYPDAEEDVLQNISFKAEPGTTTAFIGSTGSGKSTLINLIPRFFDVTGGKILIDGIDIRDAKLKELRDKIGYVPQKGVLFTGTIESNIAFGNKKINEEDIINASKISQSYDFINEKEKGFKEEISQGGTNVSGGQKQRLAIARALALNPDIYIFDDSFSALDYKTDVTLRKELNKITKDKTILIVAQRVSTIMKADQIIVLNEGKVVGMGNHKDLLKNCPIYKEIASSQLSQEELENA